MVSNTASLWFGEKLFTHNYETIQKTDLLIRITPPIVQDNYKGIEKSFEPNLPCVALWSLMVFFANGDVPLCNVDYNNKYPTGSVMKNSIKELWKSKIMNARRKLHLGGNKKDISICANCNVWDEAKGEELISPEFAEKVSILNT